MLNLDAGSVVKGVTVFRDYNDPGLFHFLPGSPRIAVEGGQPMFQLLIYRGLAPLPPAGAAGTAGDAVQGGGFLTMTTDLAVSKTLLDEVTQELSGRHGVQARLLPLQVSTGSVRVTALDSATVSGEGGAPAPAGGGADAPAIGGTRFVENLVASGRPSLYGEQRAVFTAELSRQGALLMQAGLKQAGASPVSVVYDFEYVGLLPAYDVKIRIDFSQSYRHLRTRAQMNTLWFKTDIDHELESLRKSGAIKIEEVVYETDTKEDTATRMTQLNALAKELAQWSFFKPALNPGQVLATDRGTLTAHDSTGDLTKITTGLTRQSAAALTGVGATADVGAPRRAGAALATAALEEGGDKPAAPAPAPAPATDAPAGPETAVEAWNRAGRPQGSFMLRELSQDERQTVEYDLRQVRAVKRSIAPQGQLRLLAGAESLPGRVQLVDLDGEFFKVIAGRISTSADFAASGITQVSVKLRYGLKPDGTRWKDEDEVLLTKAGDGRDYRFFVDHAGTRELEYQVVITNRPDAAIGHEAATETSAWIPTTTRNLDINPLQFGSVMRVQLEAAMVDWNLVKQIQAQLRYEDAGTGLRAADTRLLTREAPATQLAIRPRDPRVRQVSVDAVFFYADGTQETVSQRHDGDEPFVINQPPDATTLVAVTLADMLARYKRVDVQLGRPGTTPPQVKQSLVLGPETPNAQWSFRRAQPQDVGYLYRVTSFLKDGATREGPWVETDNPLLVVGDRAPGVLVVKVMVMGTLTDGGFRLAKLHLSCPSAPDWADPDVEHVFPAAGGEFEWHVPTTTPGAAAYTYTVTWFRSDGQRLVTGPVSSRDEILLLDPLAP